MTRRIPNPPLGKYPQLALWGHIGRTPTSINTRTTMRIPEILIGLPFPPADRDERSMSANWSHNSGQ